MRGEIPESARQRAMNSTIGVFPLPPQVKFPTLITGTGNLFQVRSQILLQRKAKDQKQHREIRGKRNTQVQCRFNRILVF